VELKLTQAMGIVAPSLTFNRTIVELKHLHSKFYDRSATAFNRTIVELKLCIQPVTQGSLPAFNRTIVELKPPH